MRGAPVGKVVGAAAGWGVAGRGRAGYPRPVPRRHALRGGV